MIDYKTPLQIAEEYFGLLEDSLLSSSIISLPLQTAEEDIVRVSFSGRLPLCGFGLHRSSHLPLQIAEEGVETFWG